MILFWIIVGILITGAVLAISLVTTSKAYDFKHEVDPSRRGKKNSPINDGGLLLFIFIGLIRRFPYFNVCNRHCMLFFAVTWTWTL